MYITTGKRVVALEPATGKYLWHFQAVHHDQWDMDMPPAPTLLDVRISGQNGGKPTPIARVSFAMSDLVRPEDTTETHAKACADLAQKSGGSLYNAGPFTPRSYRAPDAAPVSSVNFRRRIAGNDWAGLS
jgi:quinoprotein glucose dehydrogenase